jgi:hypothetical protein
MYASYITIPDRYSIAQFDTLLVWYTFHSLVRYTHFHICMSQFHGLVWYTFHILSYFYFRHLVCNYTCLRIKYVYASVSSMCLYRCICLCIWTYYIYPCVSIYVLHIYIHALGYVCISMCCIGSWYKSNSYWECPSRSFLWVIFRIGSFGMVMLPADYALIGCHFFLVDIVKVRLRGRCLLL